MSHHIFTDVRFDPVSLLIQIFFLIKDGHLVSNIAKIVAVLFHAGHTTATGDIYGNSSTWIQLCIILHGPGHLKYFGLNLFQNDDFSTHVHRDENLAGVFSVQLSRLLRRDLFSLLTSIQYKAY